MTDYKEKVFKQATVPNFNYRPQIPYFTVNTLYVMSRDIEEEVARYERINHELYMKKQWLNLKAEIDDEYAMKKAERIK